MTVATKETRDSKEQRMAAETAVMYDYQFFTKYFPESYHKLDILFDYDSKTGQFQSGNGIFTLPIELGTTTVLELGMSEKMQFWHMRRVFGPKDKISTIVAAEQKRHKAHRAVTKLLPEHTK